MVGDRLLHLLHELPIDYEQLARKDQAQQLDHQTQNIDSKTNLGILG